MAQWSTIQTGLGWGGSSLNLPDDLEEQDMKHVQEYLDSYMDASYPEFEPEVVMLLRNYWDGKGAPRADQKEYFLPALKALDYDGDYFYSPSKDGKWDELELVATCLQVGFDFGSAFGNAVLGHYEDEEANKIVHAAPHDGCNCGIYGSVNIEELQWWKNHPIKETELRWDWNEYSSIQSKKRVICLIEPSPDADVILCRKGWKASKAFISEVIYSEHPALVPTMNTEQASQLLSIAWKRNINVQGVFDENR